MNSSIEQGIREQFDILRFSKNSIINIELKSSVPNKEMASIQNQLIRHKYMLELFKDKKVHVFTFVTDSKVLYMLNKDNKLQAIPKDNLTDYIDSDFLKENKLNEIDSTAMVVSPYNEPERFLKHTYFLNNNQNDIETKILSDSSNLIVLKGGPGSGKSLVLFDLAKKYFKEGKKVAIFFCAKLDNIAELNELYDFDVFSTNHPSFKLKEEELLKYDIILVDETQRMYSNHDTKFSEDKDLQKFINLTNRIKIIFSIDQRQAIHKSEISRNNQLYLESLEQAEIYELKYKVRTDKSLAIFIEKMLNLSKNNLEVVDFPNVSISYFEQKEHAIEYTNYLRIKNGFKLIELSEYITQTTRVRKRSKLNYASTDLFNVYGQEYDYVAIILDEYFSYQDGKLVGTYGEYYPYNQSRSVAQALTRVKRKLEIIVFNNPDVYSTLQKLMTWKEDKVTNSSYRYYDIGLHTNKNSLKN